MPLAELAAYLGIGAVVGFFAGLLGIGGGIIIVSSLALMFKAHDFAPDFVMHLAIGTSLAAMAAGALSSLRAHHRHGAGARRGRLHRRLHRARGRRHLPQVLLPRLHDLRDGADGVQPAPGAVAS